jgi:hypothetical protein
MPTIELLRLIAEALELESNDPAVVAAFDRLELRGQLVPFWELVGWSCGQVERVVLPLKG